MRKEWTAEEVIKFKELHPITSNKELMEKFGRSLASVTNKAKELGLHKVYKPVLVPHNKKTLESINNEVQLKYPYLEFINYNGARINSTVRDNRCNHTWEVRSDYIINRDIGAKCPECNDTPRKLVEKDILKRLEGTEILELTTEYVNSKTPVGIKYKCGHETTVLLNDLHVKGTKSICRVCTPQSYNAKTQEQFIEEVYNINPDLALLEPYRGDEEYIKVQSKICKHTWNIFPHNFLAKRTLNKCPICFPQASSAELDLREFIEKNYNGWKIFSDRDILEGKELDIVLPDLGLAFEFNGVYWHSEEKKGRNYHKDKTDKVSAFGYQLIHVNEDEWVYKQDIVKSRIRNLLGLSTKVYARKCTVKEINYPSSFLEENHIQGKGAPTSINLGLFYYDELVSVMTFSRPKFSKEYDYELVRFCSLLDIIVVGGASKLFKYFTKKYKGSVISYSDRRWSTGHIYKQLGFSYSHTSEPNYRYYKGYKSLSRYECQKHLLKDKFPNSYKEYLSEQEILKIEGYRPTYDSGNDVWVYVI